LVRPIGDHAPVFEVDGPRPPCGDIPFMRDDDDADAVLGSQARKNLHDLLARFRVEVSRRLVRQQQPRIVHQRARNGDALLLPTRELIGVMLLSIAQPDGRDGAARTFAAFRRLECAGARVEKRQLDVLDRRRPRQ
jgi:hypothetical protein